MPIEVVLNLDHDGGLIDLAIAQALDAAEFEGQDVLWQC
jgi:hypothetical protein